MTLCNSCHCCIDPLLRTSCLKVQWTLTSSQTFDPTENGLCQGLSLIQDSCALRWASWAAFLASLIRESRCSREGMVVFLVSWYTCRVYPMRRLKGVFFVVADGQEFLVYCARGGHMCQLFCWVLQNIQRYCSRVWLVLSLALLV